MRVTTRSRRILRLHNAAFILLFLAAIGLAAWLSTQYNFQADWTATGRNTLSKASVTLVRGLEGPVEITAYARPTPLLRKRITELVARYQRYKPDMRLEFVNPDQAPRMVRELNITMDGEMMIRYRDSTEKLRDISESGLTNALQRVARGGERRLVFLTGHGERKPEGGASYDLSGWSRELESKGVQVKVLNLAQTPEIPADTTVLVIVSPEVNLLPGEVEIVRNYVRDGGNLLWMADPDEGLGGLEPLAEQLGLQFPPGVVVDPNVSQVGMMLFGTDDPRMALVARYPQHAITRDFEMNTLFPVAGGIVAGDNAWRATNLLRTMANAWGETGEIAGRVVYDEGEDTEGPLTIGLALERDLSGDPDEGPDSVEETGPAATQRVVMIRDGDFLSNGFVGLGGNLQLGLNIVNWLASDEEFIDIPVRTAPDASLQLSQTEIAVIGTGFLGVVPALLLGSGLWIWLRRRRR